MFGVLLTVPEVQDVGLADLLHLWPQGRVPAGLCTIHRYHCLILWVEKKKLDSGEVGRSFLVDLVGSVHVRPSYRRGCWDEDPQSV